MQKIEEMRDFFTARTNGYDEHMLSNVVGCKEGYEKMAELVPENTARLLDLGCGTGLELDEIFKKFPSLEVVGIDLTQSMLDKLREKHSDKKLDLVCGDYFSVDFGERKFDCAVSFETMHHFSHESKIELYRKIRSALFEGGCYIECDYMADTQEEEDAFFAEYKRLQEAQRLDGRAFYHFDTPCTVENQIMMLKKAGFTSVERVFKLGATTMLIAGK